MAPSMINGINIKYSGNKKVGKSLRENVFKWSRNQKKCNVVNFIRSVLLIKFIKLGLVVEIFISFQSLIKG